MLVQFEGNPDSFLTLQTQGWCYITNKCNEMPTVSGVSMYSQTFVIDTRKSRGLRQFAVLTRGRCAPAWVQPVMQLLLCFLFTGCAMEPLTEDSQGSMTPGVLDWELPGIEVIANPTPPQHLSTVSSNAGSGQIVSLETNASNHFNSQAEVSIAANPADPDHVVAATMSLDNQLMILTTRDGGLSWSQVRLPLLGGAGNHADPMLVFDANGDIHLTFIPVVNGNQVLGIEVTASRDGGDSWETPQRISSNPQDDKTAIAADRHPGSPHLGNVYVAWKLVRGGILVATLTSGASKYSAPVMFSSNAISGLDLTVGDDGAVYLSAANGTQGSISVWRSTDGGQSFGPSKWVAGTRGQAYTRTPSVCTRKALIHSSIAFSRAHPTDSGHLYVTWNDYAIDAGSRQICNTTCTCDSDVFMSSSDDRGQTWSFPVTVGQTAQAGDQYHAWLDVDETGTVVVGYKDTRDDPTRLKTHTYLSYSIDGGVTWQPDVRLSSVSASSQSSFQYGDYQGLSTSADRIYTAWADFRGSSTRSDLYVARTTLGLPAKFHINFGVSGAWFEPTTTGQGFFLEAIPNSKQLALAWFTFLPLNVNAAPDEANHYWLTGLGNYDGNVANLDLTLTTGGEFDLGTTVQNSPPNTVGSVSIVFHSCISATLTYELLQENLSGVIELERIAAQDTC